MKLSQPFFRLPLRFDVERLRAEVGGFAEEEWNRHPTGYAGNSAIRLISADGGENDRVSGQMAPAAAFRRCPYIEQILAGFGVVWSRSRLMRLGPHSVVPPHSDVNYHWYHRVRIHIPVITYPQVRFHCGDQDVHMAAGECWVFDNWRGHHVDNPTDHDRVHLVADTTGSAEFWQLVERSQSGDFETQAGPKPQFVPYRPGMKVQLHTERYNTPVVMPPAEIESLVRDLRDDLAVEFDTPEGRVAIDGWRSLLDGFCQQWRSIWSLYADTQEGWPGYNELCQRLWQSVRGITVPMYMWSNRAPALDVLQGRVLACALQPPNVAPAEEREYSTKPASAATRRSAPGVTFDRPIFIVAAPRSGSTLLFETLACSEALWTAGDETHCVIESHAELLPSAPGVESNRLTAAHATPALAADIIAAFTAKLRNREGHAPAAGTAVRFLEKTPKNALRIPFFKSLFPDARFIFLWREPEENISSIMEAWRTDRWITYRDLPGWEGPWSLLLPPGWQQLRGKPLEEIATYQWQQTNMQILEDLAQIERERWTALSYADFVRDPATQIARICSFAGIPFDAELQKRCAAPLPVSRYTLTAPAEGKWRENEQALAKVLPGVSGTLQKLKQLAA